MKQEKATKPVQTGNKPKINIKARLAQRKKTSPKGRMGGPDPDVYLS